MTWSAPSEATRSRFLVLHTPVTSAPNALAIWTAKVPTPPDAPLISTCCPGWIRPLSRSPCRAVSPATGTAAACSNDTLAGFSTSASSGTVTYSAKVPVPAPNTSSPGSKRVTFPPTASTTPARSRPSLDLGLRSPICGRATQGVPVMAYQSAGFTEAAWTRTSTSSSPGSGWSISRSSSTSGGPKLSWTIAFTAGPPLPANVLGHVGMVEDHRLLHGELAALPRLDGPPVHGQGDGDVDERQPDGVEVDALVVGLPARLLAGHDLVEVAVDVGVAELAVLVHPAQGLGAVLHRLPVVAHDLLALPGHRILVLPAADVAVEGARLHPGGLEQGRLGAGRGDQDVGLLHCPGAVGAGRHQLHAGDQRRQLPDELLLLLGRPGRDPALGQGRAGRLHGQQVHLGLLAAADEADHPGVSGREVPGCQGPHRPDPDVGGQRPLEHRDREPPVDLGEDEQRGQVLEAEPGHVGREDRHPLHAADLLQQQGRGQAVDPLLRLLVEDLHDLLREQHVAVAVGQQRRLGRLDGQPEVEAARLEEVFLGQVGEADRVLGLAHVPHFSRKATARQNAASPPTNFHGKQPNWMRWSSTSSIWPPRFSMWITSWGNSRVCMIWRSCLGNSSSRERPSAASASSASSGRILRMTVFIGWSALPASTASQRTPRSSTHSANSRVGPGWRTK